jgi:hypothetical protein
MRSARKIWISRIALLCVLGIVPIWPLIAFVIIGTWVIYIVAAATYYQIYHGRSLERGLGFEHGKLYRRDGRILESALAIRTVVEGSVFANAGFQTNDVLPDWSFTEFFRHLHHNRGQVVELEVVDGDCEGPPFQNRPRRTLRFAVPNSAEASPSRDDLQAVISILCPFVFTCVAGAIGYFASQAALPAGPPWAQLLIVYVAASVGLHMGILAGRRAGKKG